MSIVHLSAEAQAVIAGLLNPDVTVNEDGNSEVFASEEVWQELADRFPFRLFEEAQKKEGVIE